jgi:hypothetical protein
MTPFYEGWTRSRRIMDELSRPHEPADEIVRPTVGYRIGRGLVHLGTSLMKKRVVTRPELDLAA